MDKKTKKSLKIAAGIFLILVGGYLVFLNLSSPMIITGFLLAAGGIGLIVSNGD